MSVSNSIPVDFLKWYISVANASQDLTARFDDYDS